MVSSPKDKSSPPAETAPPSGQLNPTPGGAPPPWLNFLPDDPTAMATGLKASMFQPTSTAAANPPPGGAVGGSASAGLPSSGANAGALASLSPGARQAYEQAMAAGDQVEAARILLSAQMQQGQGRPPVNTADQSQLQRYGSDKGGGRQSHTAGLF